MRREDFLVTCWSYFRLCLEETLHFQTEFMKLMTPMLF